MSILPDIDVRFGMFGESLHPRTVFYDELLKVDIKAESWSMKRLLKAHKLAEYLILSQPMYDITIDQMQSEKMKGTIDMTKKLNE